MDRRDFMTTVAGSVGAGALAGGAVAATTSGAGASRWSGLAARFRDEPLMPLDRARELMARWGWDGMVVTQPANVHHVANFLPLIDRMGMGPTCAVLLSRDPRQRPVLVVPQFTYYYIYADVGPRSYLDHWLYTGPADDSGTVAQPAMQFRVMPDTEPSPRERERRARLAPYLDRLQPSLAAAIGAAARAIGLDRGKLGVDDATTAALVTQAGLNVQTVPARDALARLRLVKSPLEIDVMRAVASANREAALAAAAVARDRPTLAEVRAAYTAEAAARGLTTVFMVIDRVSNELVDAPLVPGHSALLDCVSHWQHYHGDYGRTLCIGEPTRAVRRATAGLTHAWNAIREQLKPGLTYSDVRAIGLKAIKDGGYDVTPFFNPHSVGLWHTDEPRDFRAGAPVKADLTLEPGMVLSIDCPLFDEGIGGSGHLEDLTLITRDGSELLHPGGDEVLVV